MNSSRRLPLTPLVLLCVAAGCASQTAPEAEDPSDPSFDELKSHELDSERQQFIDDRREQLAEVSKEMEEVRSKLDGPSKSNEAQRADWSNRLFELEQQQNQLRAELDRAEQASDEEWKAMRGDLRVAIDTLQAGVAKLGSEISNVVSSDERKVRADAGLCPVYVADAQTEVETQGEQVLVKITTSDEKDVTNLRQRASNLSQMKNYRPATSEPPPTDRGYASPEEQEKADSESIPLQRVAVENIDDGVRITFVPAAQQQHERFRQQLSEDAKRLEAGECETAERSEMSTVN